MNKQDYKFSMCWDINGNRYFELLKKGEKKFINESELKFIIEELKDFISKLK